MNLLIIGLGNIGKRHLESALKLDSIKHIYLYDIDRRKLDEIAKLNKNIFVLDNLNLSPAKLDFCIVATSSLNREEIIINQLKRSKIQYLILEKILFQTIDSYDLINDKFKKSYTKVFVNCPMRLMSDYIKLKNSLKGKRVYKITFTGGKNCGLATNAIHYLDFVAYLSSSKDITNYVLESDLDELIIPSKREGYIEVTGKLTGNINGIEFIIECNNVERNMIIEIELQNQTIRIDETSGRIRFNSEEDYEDFKIDFVSHTTYVALKNLVENGTCNLINYYDSSILHKLLILEILKHQNKFIFGSDDRCLIT